MADETGKRSKPAPKRKPPRKAQSIPDPDAGTPRDSRSTPTARARRAPGSKPIPAAPTADAGSAARPAEHRGSRARPAGRPTRPAPRPEAAAPAPAADSLSVLIVASEAHPWAKTGGLAEVVGALPPALARLGHRVTLVLPKYRGIEAAGAPLVTVLALGPSTTQVGYFEEVVSPNVTLVLVDVPALFEREALYGTADADYGDNAWRFAVFSRAALEYPRLRGVRPSIIHAHDWQTGLVPVYQKMHLSPDPHVGGVPAVFTIHNLAFQGLFPASTLPSIGLGWEVMNVQAMEYWGGISYLKAGINFSERITTVSPTYAREIVRPELGFGMDGVLARRAGDLVGILNGIDVERWNPSADPFVPAAFSVEDLSGKAAARKALLEAVGLPDAGLPVVGLVSRLTDQKGFDLIAAAADDLLALRAAWVMLGSGERRYEDLWRSLVSRHAGRVSATIGFDERLAHLIEAGADLFLMPSRFEPCGLNQMYSLRYGTVPVVRATGGLADTVQDYDPQTGSGTGFTFTDYSPGAMVQAMRRALTVFGDRQAWARIQKAGMARDHSWDASAAEYVKVYRTLTEPLGRPA